jgi:two-component system sensor histidine kinase KdpD
MTPSLDSGLLDLRTLKLHLGMRDLLATAMIIALSSVAAFALTPDLGEVAGALIFVLGITLAGALSGLAAGLIAAVVAFLLYNFYLTEPVLTLRLASGRDIAPLIVFNLCAAVAGVLAGQLKDRAQAASRSNRQLSGLLRISQALQLAARVKDVAVALSEVAPAELGMRIALFGPRGDGLAPLDEQPRPGAWRDLAAAAITDEAVRDGMLVAYRLDGSQGLIGVMLVEQADSAPLEPAFAAALVNLAALALERAALSERIAETRAAARTEELKTALLSSVSHDFRTPLTAIAASASSLIDYREQLDLETSLRLLRGIVEECERLNRYTGNLLEMSRLEAGQSPTDLQILSVSELLGAAIQRVRPRAGKRRIVRAPGDADLLVRADAALFDLVLANVLDNAILYSADGSRIEIETREDDGHCRIAVADEGQGIPAADIDRVFDRFHRVRRPAHSPPGSGLGLAIARGFVEALGGTIAASTPGIGDTGTRIVIRLPLAEETLRA